MAILLPLSRLCLPVPRRASLLASVPARPALRDYQSSIIGCVAEAFAAGHRSVLAVASTGAGKTVAIAAIVRERVARGERVLVCAHRKELLRQASEKLTAAGVEHGVIAPGAAATDHAVQVASVQTLVRRPEQATGYALVIIDEAHHSVAGAWAAPPVDASTRWSSGRRSPSCRLGGSSSAPASSRRRGSRTSPG